MITVIECASRGGEHKVVMNMKPRDYAKTPLLVYWEVTRACGLACRHCRASAAPHAHPLQLSNKEGKTLLKQILDFGDPLPHLVMTGGDPLERPDLMDLIAYARELGIEVSITPSATPKLTRQAISDLKDAGIDSMALSLDASTAEKHDHIRNVPGCYDRTLQAAKWARELDIPLQINTLVAEETVEDLPAIYELIKGLGIMRWSLFFLIAVGRGAQLNEISAERGEELMEWLLDLSMRAPFQVKTTESPSFRRVAQSRLKDVPMTAGAGTQSIKRGYGIRDGNGIMFISHIGEVYPSGFLPLEAGNVRLRTVTDIYQNSAVFTSVRDVSSLKGKCGRCEFRKVCGGSRARAFAHTGDPLESDPLCVYQPPARTKSESQVLVEA